MIEVNMLNGASPMQGNRIVTGSNIIKFCFFFIITFTSLFVKSQVVNFTSSNLPIIIINTNNQEIPNEPKIMANMGMIYNGVGIRNNVTDTYNHYNGKVGIEVRGQSSQQFPMKSYSIELWNNDSSSNNKSLLGMPSESDWVLYAPYTDKTLMRNVLAYQISRELGHWAANTRFVEVLINGDYKGVYVLMEKIKRKATRVNISSMGTNDITTPNVTGGYIFSIDKEPNGWFSNFNGLGNTNNKLRYSYIYPKETNIVQAQKNYIKSYVDSFEKYLFNMDATFQNYMNVNSFVDYFIVNEVSRNVDGYRLSSYFNKDRNGKINAGPVWDYDLAFRNANYCNGSNTSGWAYEFDRVCPNDFFAIPFWWRNLMQTNYFTNALKCRYEQVKNQQILGSRLFQIIDSNLAVIQEAQQRHFTRWSILGTYIWPNPQPIANTYTQEIQYLKNWLQQRLQWLMENIPNKGTCYTFVGNEFYIKLLSNPAILQTTFTITSAEEKNVKVIQTDIVGRKIFEQQILIQRGSFNYSIPNRTSGISLYSFYEGNKFLKTVKVVQPN